LYLSQASLLYTLSLHDALPILMLSSQVPTLPKRLSPITTLVVFLRTCISSCLNHCVRCSRPKYVNLVKHWAFHMTDYGVSRSQVLVLVSGLLLQGLQISLRAHVLRIR